MTAENVHCCLVVATVNVLLLLRAGEILLPLKRLRRRCNRSLFSKQLMRINACANLLLSTYTEMHKFATYTHSCQKLIDLKQKSSTESDLHRECTPAAQQQNGTGAEQACVYKGKQPKCNQLSQPVYCKEMSCNSRTAVVWRLPPTFAISLWLKVVTATSYSQSPKKHQCDVC